MLHHHTTRAKWRSAAPPHHACQHAPSLGGPYASSRVGVGQLQSCWPVNAHAGLFTLKWRAGLPSVGADTTGAARVRCGACGACPCATCSREPAAAVCHSTSTLSQCTQRQGQEHVYKFTRSEPHVRLDVKHLDCLHAVKPFLPWLCRRVIAMHYPAGKINSRLSCKEAWLKLDTFASRPVLPVTAMRVL